MTHEYVIAVNGKVGPLAPGVDNATAVGWAAHAVLAVGPDAMVRAISRGDSTFVDLQGCVVTPLPTDLERAVALVHEASDADVDIGALLMEMELLNEGTAIEPGSPADLACWNISEGSRRLVAVVRAGAFTEGDEHYGPFHPPAAPSNHEVAGS